MKGKGIEADDGRTEERQMMGEGNRDRWKERGERQMKEREERRMIGGWNRGR